MREVLYDVSSLLIAGILFTALMLAVETGYRIGRWRRAMASEALKSQTSAIQASLLGVLALMLGFTFSLSMQRYESRSQAVIVEANAIGTTYLRTALLAESQRARAQALMREYLALRIEAGQLDMATPQSRQMLVQRSNQVLEALWALAADAARADPNPVTSGLFVQSLNETIDAFGERDAALARHVPELVLWLLFCTFLMTASLLGYGAGVAGYRATFATFVLMALIVLLVFIIIDLDRPRRGLIHVDQASLTGLMDLMAPRP